MNDKMKLQEILKNIAEYANFEINVTCFRDTNGLLNNILIIDANSNEEEEIEVDSGVFINPNACNMRIDYTDAVKENRELNAIQSLINLLNNLKKINVDGNR